MLITGSQDLVGSRQLQPDLQDSGKAPILEFSSLVMLLWSNSLDSKAIYRTLVYLTRHDLSAVSTHRYELSTDSLADKETKVNNGRHEIYSCVPHIIIITIQIRTHYSKY